MEETAEPITADQMEDAVMEAISGVDAQRLEHLFELVELQVTETQRGRKNVLRRRLMAYLCSPGDDGEERLAQWLLVFNDLYPVGLEPKEETTEGGVTEMATEMVTNTGTGDHTGLLAAAGSLLSQHGERMGTSPVGNGQEERMAMYSAPPPIEPVSATRNNTVQQRQPQVPPQYTTNHPLQQHRVPRNNAQDEIAITRTRLRELKLPGMIGGSSESALAFSSLEFEVKRAKQLGYLDTEIVTAIIPKIADKELRKGCEMEVDMSLEDLMEMLRSCTAEARDSTAVFAEFSHAAQKEEESVATFVSRVFRLRNEISKLGTEEGVLYDLPMLKKLGFSVLTNGIRDENIRMGIRERCAGNMETTKVTMLKYAAEVVAVEAERKRRLFPKKQTTPVDINACSVEQLEQLKQMALNAPEATPRATKKKINPFTEIEELRTQMAVEINEIKGLILAQNSRFQEDRDARYREDRDGGGGDRRDRNIRRNRRPYKRCANCVTANSDSCIHCWKCCSENHKSQDCPSAAGNA